MSRLWPGSTAVDYLTIPANAAYNNTTDVCLMAIVRWGTVTPVSVNQQILAMGDTGGARGYGIGVSDTNGVLDLTHTGIANSNGTATTALLAGEWLALCLFCSSGGNATFKRYRYSNSTLATETNANTSALNIPTTDGGRIGNWISPAGTGQSFKGDKDRILVGKGRPSNANFTAWARAGTIPPELTSGGGGAVYSYWILSPSGTATNPEVDTGSAANNITSITGTTASAAFVLPDALPIPLITNISTAVHRSRYY